MTETMTKKSTGSFYTNNLIAEYITKWAIDRPDLSILEPSFGDGIFLNAAISRFEELGNESPSISGVEIQEAPFQSYISDHPKVKGYHMDYLDYRAETKMDAIVGNPPYVRLKNISAQEREKAINLVRSYGTEMQTSGSLWMPFVVHSTELLEQHGKLGFVLPYEITHVRYAVDLWKYLSANYGKLTICRIFHDFFPEVDVETVLLLAEEKGMTTDFACYKVYNTVSDLKDDQFSNAYVIPICDIVKQKKPFDRELIPSPVTRMLEKMRKRGDVTELVHDCKFKIGYVSGNKSFFHLSKEEASEKGIDINNLRKCLINAKQISSNMNTGIETAPITNYSFLFYPIQIGKAEEDYIKFGETHGVNRGYKCRVRNPWYLTPSIEVPDLVLTVFGDVPRLMLNDGEFYVSNSLLSGIARIDNKKELICRWYNSLTLLSIETTIHSLGGGTLVLIPGETDKLEIISGFPSEKIDETYQKLSEYAQRNPTEEVYKYGDRIVLEEIYGFSEAEIIEIQKTIASFRNWRNPEKRRG